MNKKELGSPKTYHFLIRIITISAIKYRKKSSYLSSSSSMTAQYGATEYSVSDHVEKSVLALYRNFL